MTKIIKRLNITVLAGVIAATSVLSIHSSLAFEPKKGKKQRAENTFTHLDINLDGVLSLNEMMEPISEKATKILTRRDANQDSLLTLEEMQKRRRQEATDLTLITEELVQCVSEIKAATGNAAINVPNIEDFKTTEEKFAVVDTSADEFIDITELQDAMLLKATNRFSAMDKDENGEVTNDEFSAHIESRQETRKAIRECKNEIQDSEDII